MKCPECSYNQKASYRTICSQCGYNFALNPKEYPFVSDKAFKIALDKLTGSDQFYITFNQLFFAIHKLAKKKIKTKRVGILIAAIIFLSIASFFLVNLFDSYSVLLLTIPLFPLFFYLIIIRKIHISHAGIIKVIDKYRAVHNIGNLVDGTQFKDLKQEDMPEEYLNYAPEHIVIVEHNDITDMLIMNKFPMEHKALVVSTSKYPNRAFHAFQQFLQNHPEIPIFLIHDLSYRGMQLKQKILSDKSWNLEGKNIKDLGLFPKDIDRIKEPVWITTSGSGTIENGTTMEKVRQGMVFPADYTRPVALMGAFSMALAMGLPLLSEELLAQQISQSNAMFSGGDFG